ncbi:1-(5-phosphoribosyl)-5-amino-4-imidazole- carboxylate (AIR) carboxylase [Spirochaeta thermophila DSM 6578]|uniref:1-(5-phosphoribosyl)-5-amino-4-imidazole-carboxylate (AIR) carboxylase n=1 Tax=Winmispira thermophila (strain ATCC 700085 / DSM 6578 / Z-1203) TaxID=869211 RepID=G0GDP5_WINT7|nr:nickel pincer cofactor biosynthesis protein LarB [Spirochaeta thermophila]AEJ62175.1 1-(5-phosphoribosyl)-5-amino-4-imidazole- carboxylate (AIR) carboxylase [Spirochaeta thermophila DSM 6578]
MDRRERMRRLLAAYREGRVPEEEAISRLEELSFVRLGHSTLDMARPVRTGRGEVVFAEGKKTEHLLEIVEVFLSRGENLLVSRVREDQLGPLLERFPRLVYHAEARCCTHVASPPPPCAHRVGVVTGGTSDVPVAEEAAITCEFYGVGVERVYDVGVAGINRLLARLEEMRSLRALVVVAGMEGALPSVVAGLVDRPVIGVPTSVGYGAALEGMTPLLAMLTSCVPGLAVVNIDNGFGAGYLASLIARL